MAIGYVLRSPLIKSRIAARALGAPSVDISIHSLVISSHRRRHLAYGVLFVDEVSDGVDLD